MEYMIKPEQKFHKILKQLQSKVEDTLLAAILLVANITKSKKISNWINRYTEKKIQKMQAEIIRMRWDKITLDKAVSSIRNNQDAHH